jgi:hypothetical protein
MSPQEARAIYDRQAGEVMANVAKDRLYMTPEQRRLRSPQKTEKIPRDQQIIRYLSRGLLRPCGPAAYHLSGVMLRAFGRSSSNLRSIASPILVRIRLTTARSATNGSVAPSAISRSHAST